MNAFIALPDLLYLLNTTDSCLIDHRYIRRTPNSMRKSRLLMIFESLKNLSAKLAIINFSKYYANNISLPLIVVRLGTEKVRIRSLLVIISMFDQ